MKDLLLRAVFLVCFYYMGKMASLCWWCVSVGIEMGNVITPWQWFESIAYTIATWLSFALAVNPNRYCEKIKQ